MNKFLELDQELFLKLNGDCGHIIDCMMWGLSSKLAFVPIGLLAIWLIYRDNRTNPKIFFTAILFIALVVLFNDQISTFFKYFTPKLRPTHTPELEGLVHTVNGYKGGHYGTVSSHAANSFGVAMFSSLLIKRRTFTWVIFIFAALVVYSRIYLGVHFPADILLGTAMGLSIGYILYLLYVKICKKISL